MGDHSKGFTLLEVITVVVVAGIVLSIATPLVAEQLRSMSLKNAIYKISGDLHIIKSQAIRTQANCQITFDDVNHRYTLSDPNRTEDLGTFNGNVVFTANPDGGGDLFSPIIGLSARGISSLAPPATTQVYVTNQDNRIFRVQVSAAGAVSIREFNPATNDWI